MSLKTKTPAEAGTKARAYFTEHHPKHTEITHGAKCSCDDVLPADAWPVDLWWPEFELLVARTQGRGIEPDLAAMCLCQCYGAYLWLKAQAE